MDKNKNKKNKPEKMKIENKKTDSNKMEHSLKQIWNVFKLAQKKGVSPGQRVNRKTGEKEEKRVNFKTIESYVGMMESLGRDYKEKYGVSDYRKWQPEKIEELIRDRFDNFHKGNTSEAYNVNSLLSALKFYNHAVENISSLQKKHRTLVDTNKMRKEKNEKNVIRYSKASKTLRATPDQSVQVLQNIAQDGYKVPTREMAYHVAKIAQLTGGRHTSVLNLKAEDITIDKKTNSVYFHKDKGGLSRSVKVDEDTAAYLVALKEEKGTEEGRLFVAKRKDGTFMSVKETRKEISRIVTDAGKHLTTTKMITIKDENGEKKEVEIEQKFSMHSFRKSFALERTHQYIKQFTSKHQVDKYFAQLIEEEKAFSGEPRLKEKLDTLYERINKDREHPRDITLVEYAIFATSLDLGHFRNDVITQFYTDFKEVRKYYEEDYPQD
ncbi:tyrosine-type recombinase/integrase [Neobacillus ginsengisoli]|uniref:Integrase n=1 Tax=Neobacillus ginsengisoli TaxID=904295 RepID=A0ABT9XNG0_9BACI|nr:tyrosine-type recombinase/integrase [Neobacillus ginsengisoli]MDQ0197078.1 integrase [Neobacillus ginsengisoli]